MQRDRGKPGMRNVSVKIAPRARRRCRMAEDLTTGTTRRAGRGSGLRRHPTRPCSRAIALFILTASPPSPLARSAGGRTADAESVVERRSRAGQVLFQCTARRSPSTSRRSRSSRVIGVQPEPEDRNPRAERITPIHTGCAETPIGTNTIDVLSSSERGRNADEDPDRERRSVIHSNAPPKLTSEAVTGAAGRAPSCSRSGGDERLARGRGDTTSFACSDIARTAS